ncbi:MAG: metallophosphoesterase family protein [candidate division KSB1 bacterium]|nr:metallophosphoesterase family protein [candidate division KSB1 bacterium]
MRYAIISDIHSNLEALTAVFEHIDTQNADEIICLGDIVGYGPNPNECIDLVRTHCSIVLQGNHDFASLDSSRADYFNEYARKAIYWTIECLEESKSAFLSSLPLAGKAGGALFVHASPEEPVAWNYIFSLDDAIRNFSYFDTPVCFHGHSHIPINYIQSDEHDFCINKDVEIYINENEKYLINVGSVGQPRDGNPDGAYGMFDSETKEFRLHRVAYDVATVQNKMRGFDLPLFLIRRLETGR